MPRTKAAYTHPTLLVHSGVYSLEEAEKPEDKNRPRAEIQLPLGHTRRLRNKRNRVRDAKAARA